MELQQGFYVQFPVSKKVFFSPGLVLDVLPVWTINRQMMSSLLKGELVLIQWSL